MTCCNRGTIAFSTLLILALASSSVSAAVVDGSGDIDNTDSRLFARYTGDSYDGATWTDVSSGAGNNLTLSGGDKPTKISAGSGSGQPNNGNAYASFDGNDRIYGAAADLTGGQYTVFLVGRLDSAGGYFFDGTTSTQRGALLTNTGGTDAWHTFASGAAATVSSSTSALTSVLGDWVVHTIQVNGSSTTQSYHSVNTKPVDASGDMSGTGTFQTVILGARVNQANLLDGGIADILIYDDVLSRDEQVQVQTSLLNKYIKTAETGRVLARYDASNGNPAVAGDVQSPNDQGWSDFDAVLGGTNVQEGVIESGKPAWRNLDGTDNDNPGYMQTLTNDAYQRMFDQGWEMEMVIRLEDGGHFFSWGGDETNTAGNFNFAGDRRAGASLSESGDDYIITPTGTGGSAITITDGILNDTYIRALLRGGPESTQYTFSVFDADTGAQIGSTQLITAFATGNSSSDNGIAWQSGSSSGDNREAYVRSFSLTLQTAPEPSTLLLGLLSIAGLACTLRRRPGRSC